MPGPSDGRADGEDPMLPDTPPAAVTVFGVRLPHAVAYVEALANTGIAHGLIGPREAPRLWDRHVLNSAVVAPLFRSDSSVADIGSGAGLPGIPLAIARPDLDVVLVEPLQRRVIWLSATIERLELTNVTIHRGRAESLWGVRRFDSVTARAVAATARLATLTLPLVHAGGALHALKGDRAEIERDQDRVVLETLGATRCEISRWGAGVVDPETVVLSVGIDATVPPPGIHATARRSRKGRPSR